MLLWFSLLLNSRARQHRPFCAVCLTSYTLLSAICKATRYQPRVCLIPACRKCSPHQHRDCQSLQESTLGMQDFEAAKCSQQQRCHQENLPKASLGLNCESVFLWCMEGVEVPGLRFPLQGCKCQPEGTWHLPSQQGHFPGPDNCLSEL